MGRDRRVGKEAAMNRLEKRPPAAAEAQIEYLDGDIRVIRPGAFVRCAVTGVPIALDELRYWSVDLQEAYAGPEAVLKRLERRRA
jgi:hypothetical protein